MDFKTDLLLLLTKVQEIKSMGSQFADIGPDMWLIQVLVDFNIRDVFEKKEMYLPLWWEC